MTRPGPAPSATTLRPASRRLILWLLAAGLALAAGVGLSLSRMSPQPASAAGWLFELSYPRPDGTSAALSTARGRLTVVNFWASWCLPCVQEMPDLSRLHSELSSSGVRVVGLAIDSPSSVKAFLADTPVSYPVFIVGAAGTELGRRLGNPADALPFTALINESGVVVQHKLGKISEEELRSWVLKAK